MTVTIQDYHIIILAATVAGVVVGLLNSCINYGCRGKLEKSFWGGFAGLCFGSIIALVISVEDQRKLQKQTAFQKSIEALPAQQWVDLANLAEKAINEGWRDSDGSKVKIAIVMNKFHQSNPPTIAFELYEGISENVERAFGASLMAQEITQYLTLELGEQ